MSGRMVTSFVGAYPSCSPLPFNHSFSINLLRASNTIGLKEQKKVALFRPIPAICDGNLNERM